MSKVPLHVQTNLQAPIEELRGLLPQLHMRCRPGVHGFGVKLLAFRDEG